MTEASLVDRLIAHGLSFPWRRRSLVTHQKEVPSLWNRADIVYYEIMPGKQVGFIVAVEAKLRNWRCALQQAYRNKLFADRVYVALPDCYAEPAIQRIADFRMANVGLVLVGQDRNKVLYHPRINQSQSSTHKARVVAHLASSL